MNKFITTFVLLQLFVAPVFSTSVDNYYGEDFYSQRDSWSNELLKENLHNILSQFHIYRNSKPDLIRNTCTSHNCYRHTEFEYKEARRVLFGQIHLEQIGNDYAISDVYCNFLFTENDFSSYPPGPNQIPDHNVINAEHTWPRSRFNHRFSVLYQLSDLHNLYPAESKTNSLRSNHPFGDVSYVDSQICSDSKKGQRNSVDSTDYFEVPDSHKGNVARSVFYFSVRYKIELDAIEEDTLRTWHFMDPPDEFEAYRNDSIAEFQKNRNPFIDFPELVDQIDDF